MSQTRQLYCRVLGGLNVTKLKRYWVFLYATYYPGGGMNDFAGSFETVEEAFRCVEKEFEGPWGSHDNFHILDTRDGVILDAFDTEIGGDVVSQPVKCLQNRVNQINEEVDNAQEKLND